MYKYNILKSPEYQDDYIYQGRNGSTVMRFIMITSSFSRQLGRVQQDFDFGENQSTNDLYHSLFCAYNYNHEKLIDDLAVLTLDEASVEFCREKHFISAFGFVRFLKQHYVNYMSWKPFKGKLGQSLECVSFFIQSLDGKNYEFAENDLASAIDSL